MKKALSVLLTLALLVTVILSVPAISTGAADADAYGGAESGAANTISFDANSVGWYDATDVRFHIWALDDDSFEGYDWGSKKQKATDDGNNIWTYDLDKYDLSIRSGCQYCVIFYNNITGAQTYNLIFGAECIGHTAYCDGTTYENPEDSTKTATAAFWGGGIDASVYGPELRVSSIGTVVGTCCPSSTSPYRLFVGFLRDTLPNARTYSGKADQELLDDTASALGLQKGDVSGAIAESHVSVDWSESKSSLPGGGTVAPPDSGSGGNSSGSDYYSSFNPYHIHIDPDTPYGNFCNYLTGGDFADDMRRYGNKTEQQLIDSAAATFGLYRDDVALALQECGADAVAWKSASSTLPKGKSGLTYVKGGYYIIGTRKGEDIGVNNVDKNALLQKDDSGYYVISDFSFYQGDSVQVARCDGGKKFTIVSKAASAIPRYSEYLFFFRPESDGYNFGFNYDTEYNQYGDSAGSSGSSGSGTINYPVISKIENTLSGPKLTWNKMSGAVKYRVFFDNNGSWQKITDTTSTSYTHTAAKSGTVYRYTIRGIGSDGKFCTTYNTTGWYYRWIAAPKITGVKNTSDGALISWNASAGNARYRVYVKDGINWQILGDTYDTSFLHAAKKETSNPASSTSSGPKVIKSYPRRSGNVITFDAAGAGWTGIEYVGFHIWAIDDWDFYGYDWGGKKQRGTDNGDGTWSYDLDKHDLYLTPGCRYCVVFYSSYGAMTYHLVFDSSCLGHTAYCDGTYCESPYDSNKTCLTAFWDSGIDYKKCGPQLKITSIGNVTGSCFAEEDPPLDCFIDFLDNDFYFARSYSPKTDQQMIDDIAAAFGLSDDDVQYAIDYTGTDPDWRSSGNTGANTIYAENGYTYRYMVSCVSYDGTCNIGPSDTTGVSNQYVKTDTPAVNPTQPPTVFPTEPAPQYMRGDYDGDNDITILDATRVQRFLAELDAMPSASFLTGVDADGDNELTILDATRIQNVIAELMNMDGSRPV